MQPMKQSRGLAFMAWLAVALSYAVDASGATIHVPGAYSTIQAAIDAADSGDTVKVADGTYQGVGNRDLDFKGKAITVRSANGPQTCLIDCQAVGRGVLFHSGESASSVLSGFTIMNGRAEYGGGIVCESSSPTINNCIIKDNTSSEETDGGGLAISNASPVIKNCIIVGNTSTARGGGIAIAYASAPTITNCQISANEAPYLGGGIAVGYGAAAAITATAVNRNTAQNGGGGICVGIESSATITDCVIAENHAGEAAEGGGVYTFDNSFGSLKNSAITGNTTGNSGRGGGIFLYYCKSPSWELENCTIADNVASRGGGIYLDDASISATDCAIVNNTATFSDDSIYANGGGMHFFNSSGTITGCTISGNTAHQGAGIFLVFDSTPTLINCVITKNKAYINPDFESHGGGVHADFLSAPTLTNCTVAHNSDTGGGAGISYFPGALPVIANSIIWANTPGEIHEVTGGTTTLSVTHSNVKGGYPGVGNINKNPLFVDTAKSDYHLRAGSPCINKGSNAAVGLPPTDKNGNQRIVNGKTDMGAYEYTGSRTTPVVRATTPDAVALEPPTVDFGKVSLSRTGDLSTKMTVKLVVTGTAVNGTDYRQRPAQATIPAGKSSGSILVKPLADDLSEGDETAVITILSGSSYEIGSPGVAKVIIKDNGS